MIGEKKQAKYLALAGWVVLLVVLLGTVYFLIDGVDVEHAGGMSHFPPFYNFEVYVIMYVVLFIGGLILNHAHYKKSWTLVIPWTLVAVSILTDFLYVFYLAIQTV